ncbi:transmembrane protein PMIS2 [Peromyscus maniculatus bairdii]
MAEAAGRKVRQPLGRPQTSEELAFYARTHIFLTICALLLCPPFGLLGLLFAHKTKEANQYSDWEDAYLNSTRTIWMDVLGILVGLGIIYYYVLFM